ncbi:helix-turn-helix domain-containing protein [Pedosphaera parvula]|uniref:HTH cro/C1-type domain-containing protein n=1 Tax=Pedosphaera parvula (strain Ellin514) TaxID=320771 RepID=B9XA32_PEDPL|nr:helix-turn-helix transcriptional regulator [Pedosphaera parvula]EEF63373.1 hypothetical protein Cflav_PD6008 [Pedosphaera parvula Ellin514]
MRQSKQQHPLAVLRVAAGLSQKEMGALLRRSTSTIQSIELGRLALGANLAERVVLNTAVSMQWLMEGDVSKPVVDFAGDPYTRESFEAARAELDRPRGGFTDVQSIENGFADHCTNLAAVVLAGLEQNRLPLLYWKCGQFLTELIREFGVDQGFLTQANSLMANEVKIHRLPKVMGLFPEMVASQVAKLMKKHPAWEEQYRKSAVENLQAMLKESVSKGGKPVVDYTIEVRANSAESQTPNRRAASGEHGRGKPKSHRKRAKKRSQNVRTIPNKKFVF